MATKRTKAPTLPQTAPAFIDVMARLAVIDDVVGLLLRTCDDSIKRRMNPAQKECLMAACDDVRAVLGYTGRYLTPRERKRLGISTFVPKGMGGNREGR